MLYPLWKAASLTVMQLLNTIGFGDPGSLMSTSLLKTGQFFQLLAVFELQNAQDSIAQNTSLTFTNRIRIPKRKTGPKQK
jgi:hypothetical protein